MNLYQMVKKFYLRCLGYLGSPANEHNQTKFTSNGFWYTELNAGVNCERPFNESQYELLDWE